MQFSTLTLAAAMSVVGVFAQSNSTGGSTGPANAGMVTVHVVKVGGGNGTLAFAPNEIKANAGDMIQFQFAPNNHSVVQSTFDAPCVASSQIFSGYMPVTATSTTTPTWTIMVNDTKPMWFYCSQGKHCQAGMSMVVNVASGGNKTLAAYQAAAKSVTQSTIPAGAATSGGSGSGNGTESGSPTTGGGSGSGTGEGAATTSSPSTTTGAGSIVQASGTLAMVAMVAAFFL